MPAAIIDRLRAEFDATTILTGADIGARYHTDMAGVAVDLPVAVVRPRTTEDVSRILKLCHAARVPVTTQGGMTGLVRATMPASISLPRAVEVSSQIEKTLREFPEVDRAAFFALPDAQPKLHPAEVPLLERLRALIDDSP